jgi:hypothetical protein
LPNRLQSREESAAPFLIALRAEKAEGQKKQIEKEIYLQSTNRERNRLRRCSQRSALKMPNAKQIEREIYLIVNSHERNRLRRSL